MKYLLIVLSFISLTTFSQIIKKSSIDSGGTSITNGNVSVTYTVGELVIQEKTTGNIHLSEGFIGKDIQQVLGVYNFELFNNFKVYPNPAIDYVNVKFNKPSNYNIVITDLKGSMIKKITTHENLNKIDLSNLNNGTYFLIIIDVNSNTYNSIKIIKK